MLCLLTTAEFQSVAPLAADTTHKNAHSLVHQKQFLRHSIHSKGAFSLSWHSLTHMVVGSLGKVFAKIW